MVVGRSPTDQDADPRFGSRFQSLAPPSAAETRRIALAIRRKVFRCSGPYCVFSFDAESILRQHGLDVHRLEDGFPQWKAAGLAVEVERAQAISP